VEAIPERYPQVRPWQTSLENQVWRIRPCMLQPVISETLFVASFEQ
jgi:hypothetical protein